MKKNLFKLLPLFLVASCSTLPAVEEEFKPYVDNAYGLPTVHTTRDATFKTFLMLSPYGSIKVGDTEYVKGEVSDLYYENTVVWLAQPGSPLPGKDDVKSSVNGATFRGWAYYDQNDATIYPTYYETVPTIEGLALKAIFDGSDAGGSGGGGGGGTVTDTGFGIIINDTNKVHGADKGISEISGKQEYLITAQGFKNGDKFALYDFANNVPWTVDINPYSFGCNGDGTKVAAWVTNDGSYYTVHQDFTADVYLQIAMGADAIYLELK